MPQIIELVVRKGSLADERVNLTAHVKYIGHLRDWARGDIKSINQEINDHTQGSTPQQ